MSKPKVNIVAWSGGLDSTLILDRLCSSKKSVWAFSVNWSPINKLQTKQQQVVRKNYLNYAKKKGYKIHYRQVYIRADMGVIHQGLPQALAWFCFLATYLPESSTLHFGYHRGDDFWGHSLSFKYLMEWATYIGDRKVKLEFPLQFMSKYEILAEVKERNIPTSCVWTCERPTQIGKRIVSCGKCTPCLNLKLASYESRLRKTGG